MRYLRASKFVFSLVVVSLAAACGAKASSRAPSAGATQRVEAAREVDRAEASASAAASASAKPVASHAADEILFQREQCLESVGCSREQFAKLVIEADDAGATVDCGLFYRGVGVPKDWKRARACYEREVKDEPCDGSSPSLARDFLATMLVDGQGGPTDPALAHAVFAGCFEDMAVLGVFVASLGSSARPGVTKGSRRRLRTALVLSTSVEMSEGRRCRCPSAPLKGSRLRTCRGSSFEKMWPRVSGEVRSRMKRSHSKRSRGSPWLPQMPMPILQGAGR
jgi:hypothetical protein